jgi:hypothetical protein
MVSLFRVDLLGLRLSSVTLLASVLVFLVDLSLLRMLRAGVASVGIVL